jgi:ABC-type antimicrobial peptide transport system permease subunit
MLRLVLNDLRADPFRSLFSAAGIAVVVMSAFLLNALSTGVSSVLSAAPVSTNLLIIDASYNHPSDSTIPLSLLDSLKAWTPRPVQQISPSFYRQMRINGRITQLRAAAPGDWPQVYNMSLVEGHWPSSNREVVAGEGLAVANGWHSGAVLEIYGESFSISGIYRAPGTGISAVWMSMDAAQALFGAERSIQMITLVLPPGADPVQVSADLQKSPALAGKFSVFLRDSYTRRNGQFIRDIYGLTAIVSFLALLAVPLSTYSLTLLNIAERARVLGILRAVGFGQSSVHAFLILRALVIAAGAYVLGLGGAEVFIAARHAAGPIFIMGVQLIFALSGSSLGSILAMTLVFAWVGAWWSSRRPMQTSIHILLKD